MSPLRPIFTSFRPLPLQPLRPPATWARRAFSSATDALPPPRSRFRRAASLVFRGLFFTSLGYLLVFTHATRPLWKEIDTGALSKRHGTHHDLRHAAEAAYTPDTPEAAALEAQLDAHPFVQELRSPAGRARLPVEQRPMLRMPSFMARHSLTASTLSGLDLVAVPPRQWTDGRGRELVQIWHLGPGLCGHPDIVHGGFVATMLDESLARCCFPALPLRMGQTAFLHIDYRAPTPAGAFVVVHAKTARVEGRKAWVQARLETLPEVRPDGTTAPPVVLAEAEALFVGFRDRGLGKYLPEMNI